VNIGAIRDALLELPKEKASIVFLHPESLLITMTRMEAETWKRRLKGINWQHALADRELLLDS